MKEAGGREMGHCSWECPTRQTSSAIGLRRRQPEIAQVDEKRNPQRQKTKFKAERLPKIFGFVFFLVPVTSAAGKVTLANCVVLFGLVSSASCHNLMSTMRVMRAAKQINSRLFAGEVAFGEIFAVALPRSST
ncbi:hypothetical protein RUM43_003282 [Polyplax serrata]|uniref:Uncharacterized protein n=1 Tax=Polyplax serrata TaxID=468196 RepID=A0AAN8S341_POLSC